MWKNRRGKIRAQHDVGVGAWLLMLLQNYIGHHLKIARLDEIAGLGGRLKNFGYGVNFTAAGHLGFYSLSVREHLHCWRLTSYIFLQEWYRYWVYEPCQNPLYALFITSALYICHSKKPVDILGYFYFDYHLGQVCIWGCQILGTHHIKNSSISN